MLIRFHGHVTIIFHYRKELAKFQSPSPATYPIQKGNDGKPKNEVMSIYPKENANKFSIAGRRYK